MDEKIMKRYSLFLFFCMCILMSMYANNKNVKNIEDAYTSYYINSKEFSSSNKDYAVSNILDNTFSGNYFSDPECNLSYLRNIISLIKSYKQENLTREQKILLKSTIDKNLNICLDVIPHFSNWWYNQIAIPRLIGIACLLYHSELSSNQLKKAITFLNLSQIKMTGQNKVWLANNVLMKFLLENNYNEAKAARDTIAKELEIQYNGEGIQSDWSFQQHYAQLQTGNYGLAYASTIGSLALIFNKTPFAFNKKQIDILYSLLSNGFQWSIWKGYMDISSLGRQLYKDSQLRKADYLFNILNELQNLSGSFRSLYTTFKTNNNKTSNTLANPLVGYKFYWKSDYSIMRCPTWMATLKMSSNRVIGTETMTNDNLQGYYLGDGATYIYKDGTEYYNIFPCWDWRKIPGVTAYNSPKSVPLLKNAYYPRNTGTFVGGIAGGNMGFNVMEINRDKLYAHKCWLFTSQYIACMGSGITSDSLLDVTTAIEQSILKGKVQIYYKNKWQELKDSMNFSNSDVRFLHNGIGYVVLCRNRSVCNIQHTTGKWGTVTKASENAAPETKNIFKLYIDHGIHPQNAKYLYFILPDATKESLFQFDSNKVKVLKNDSDGQVIYDTNYNTYWIAAFKQQNILLQSNITIETLSPAILNLQIKGKNLKITCSDSTQKKRAISIKINGKLYNITISDKNKGMLNIRF